MSITIKNTYNRILKKENLNIWTPTFDGMFEYILAQAFPEHQFYCIMKPLWKFICPSPSLSNLHFLPQPEFIHDADLVICNDKLTQGEDVVNLSNILNAPILYIKHALYPQRLRKEDAYLLEKRYTSNLNICSLSIIDQYPVATYVPQKNILKKDICTIFGNFDQTDHKILSFLQQNIGKKTQILGYNPGIGQDLPINHIMDEIAASNIFINLVNYHSSIYPMLLAMVNNNHIISSITPITQFLSEQYNKIILINKTEEIPDIVKHIKDVPTKKFILDQKEFKKTFANIFDNLHKITVGA
jgi:hypothetical protein